jgi:hypothetical protein
MPEIRSQAADVAQAVVSYLFRPAVQPDDRLPQASRSTLAARRRDALTAHPATA